MQHEGQDDRKLRSEVIHARLSSDLKRRICSYAEANGVSTSAAVSQLLERAVDESSLADETMDMLAKLSERIEGMAKDCGLAAKRAGKASQASLGTLALISWIAPDLLRFLANEALMRGQILGRLLGNEKAAENVKVPVSLGRFANGSDPDAVFRMAYTELGGKLSRDPKTSFLPAWASAIDLFGLADLGLMDRDGDEWDALRKGDDARAVGELASKVRKEHNHG